MQEITVRYTVGTKTYEKRVFVMVSKNQLVIAGKKLAKPRHFSPAIPLQVSGAIANAIEKLN